MLVDLFLATSGKLFSVAVGAAAQLLIAPSDSMIRKVLGIKTVDKKLLAEFKQIGTLRREKKYAEAYRLIQGMPEAIRTRRVILDLAIQLSQNINDEEYYRQLTLLEQYHGNDPSTAYMLIDHYFSQGDMEKTNHSIDRMIARFGQDGALLNLKASIAFTSGRLAAATELARAAVMLEPDFEDAYWTLVTIYITTSQYQNAVTTMKQLEQQLGYQFQAENFADQEFYAGFVKSRAFSDWLN
jgi:tetratricopeptide (TPR) repeat protein